MFPLRSFDAQRLWASAFKHSCCRRRRRALMLSLRKAAFHLVTAPLAHYLNMEKVAPRSASHFLLKALDVHGYKTVRLPHIL